MDTTRELWQQAEKQNRFPGMQRFLVYGEKFAECLESSRSQAQPALAFYQTKSRQWLFYLQALCRVYKKVGTKKRFKGIGESIKGLEDQLGKIDYWDGWLKESAAVAGFPATMTAALQQHKNEELRTLAAMLEAGHWWSGEAMVELLENLRAEDWKKPSKDREGIVEFLTEEIEEIEQAVRQGEYDFHLLEEGVHEFRRHLRWISIYAHALYGLMQLRAVSAPSALYQKYLTESVLSSPFNQVPPVPEGIEPVWIKAPNFYALSWLIAQIGKVKDQGQKVEALHAIAAQAGLAHDRAWLACAKTMLPEKELTPAELATLVDDMVRKFVIDDTILQRWQQDLAEKG